MGNESQCDDEDGPTGIMISLENHREEIAFWKMKVAALEAFKSEPSSAVTEELRQQLAHRDAIGRRKYGKTMDRRDLRLDEWAEHAIQESLDHACYMLRVKRGATLIEQAREIMQALASERDWDCAKQWLQDYERQFGEIDMGATT